MLCETCLQGFEHLEGETAASYLSGVIRYLERPGNWRLSSPEATIAYALCDNMPRGIVHDAVVPNPGTDGTYRWLCPCGATGSGFASMDAAWEAGRAHSVDR